MPRRKTGTVEEPISKQLRSLKKKTAWSWERMCREFHRVMGEEGPSHTTLYRYAAGKVKRRNALTERYVREAIEKVGIRLVEEELQRSETQRKIIKTDLQDSEARFRSLIEAAPSVVLCLARDGKIVEFNPEAERIYACKRERAVGQNYFDSFIPKSVRKFVYNDFKKVLGGGSTRNFESPIKVADGSERVFSWNVNPLRDEQGKIRGIIAIGQDITVHQQLNKALVAVLEGISWSVGKDFPRSLVRCLAAALQVRFAFLSRLHPTKKQRVRLLAIWEGADFGNNFEYDIIGKPCEQVFKHGLTYYPAQVQKLFPLDHWLQEKHIESYLAVAVYDDTEDPIGHLGIMHDLPFRQDLPAESVLRAFAASAGAELCRDSAKATRGESEERFRNLVEH